VLRVSEQEDPVSRRQFFRGMTGGLFRAIGELSGIDKLVEEEVPAMLSFTEDDVIVPPEKQAESLSMLFGFLEQHATQEAENTDEPPPLPVEPLPVDAEAARPAPDATEAQPEPAEAQPD
jgi:hypothetical protein